MFSHYLMFNRNCEEALTVYAEAFGAEITGLQKYSDMPPDPNFPVSESDKNLVLHASLTFEGTQLMCADSSDPLTFGDNQFISVTTQDATLVQKAWDKLSEDAVIYMALTPTFFAAFHGSLRDRYGINWMFTAIK
jgi:PhnB protein